MPTSSRELLDQIADLQNALDGFSFDQLTVAEAQALKVSFNAFRSGLESRLWGTPGPLPGHQATGQSGKPADYPEELSRILVTVGHELRTPLHAISGLVQLLREEPLSDGQKNKLQNIQAAADMLLHLVGELLEYSRFQTEQEVMEPITFSPGQLIREVGYLCETLIVSKRVSFRLTLDEKIPPTLLGDPTKFSQVLMNLLGNAIKFVEEGCIDLQVWPEFASGQCLLHGEVRDTGPGISPEELPHVFDAFRQGGAPSPTYPGIGLGLSIVRKTLERLGGSISAESQVGVGTSFRFTIPFALAARGESSGAEPGSQTNPLSGKTILIIEDNLLNLKLLETRLKGWGCRVLSCEKALYGLSMLSERPVDLVMMDLRMPGLDGYQASLRIRNHENPAVRSIPIVAVSADFTAKDSDRVRKAGIDEVVLKPFSADELLGKLLGQLQKPRQAPGNSGKPMPGRFSLDGLWKECMGDLDMLDELVRLFRANLLEFLGALKVHLTLLDYEQIEQCAHKIKAGLKLVEAHGWLEKIEELRDLNGRRAGVERMRQIYRELLVAYQQADSDLDQALGQIRNNPPHG